MVTLTADPGFDISRTEEYKLSIQAGLDGFYFYVVHRHENKLIAAGQFPITISSESFLGRRFTEWHSEVELLQKNYSEVQLIYCSDKFALVPSSFYDFNKQYKIIEEAFGIQKGNSVRDNYLPEEQANLIFTIPDALKEAFEIKYPGSGILHPLSVLSKKLHQSNLNSKNKRFLALSFQKNTLSILFYFKNKLEISNIFCFQHPNDVIFYLLSVLKSRKINRSKTTLLLSGKINPGSELVPLLAEYFAQIEFFKIPVQFNESIFGEQMQKITPVF